MTLCLIRGASEYLSNIIWGEVKPNIDPRIETILIKLNLSAEYKDFLEQSSFKNVNIVYRLIKDEECEKLKIETAMVNLSRNLFRKDNVEILLKESMSDMHICRSIIMEVCNVFFRKEYFELEKLVKGGQLDQSRFAYFMEKIEYKAYSQALAISKNIDALSLYPAPLYSEDEHLAGKNFEDYYRMCVNYGHVEKYKNQWTRISH